MYILLIVFIDLKGRNTLNTLNGFKFGIFGKNSRNLKFRVNFLPQSLIKKAYPVKTTIKSNQFQESHK